MIRLIFLAACAFALKIAQTVPEDETPTDVIEDDTTVIEEETPVVEDETSSDVVEGETSTDLGTDETPTDQESRKGSRKDTRKVIRDQIQAINEYVNTNDITLAGN